MHVPPAAHRPWATRMRALPAQAWAEAETRHLVVVAAAVMVVAATAFRAWALYGGWFYGDDYPLLVRAAEDDLGLDYLVEPHSGRLLPGTRFAAWVVVESGISWPVAATMSLALSALAGASAAWMLVRVFGARWEVLAPLGIYLTTATTVPAAMWWTASMNQTPVQIAFFLGIGTWVEYLRSRRLVWLFLNVGALVFGLLFFTKTFLVVAVMGYLALAYFASGSLLTRFRTVARRYWPAVAAGAVLAGGYLVLSASAGPGQPFRVPRAELVGKIAETMVGRAFPTGIAGGPWGWNRFAPPGSVAAPPSWLVPVAWVVIVLVVLYAFLRRTRTLRAWGLLVAYLAGSLALVTLSRGRQFGEIVGLEYRYFTDVACVAILCLGLAYLPLKGALETSGPRQEPLLRPVLGFRVWAPLVSLVCVSGLLSSAAYVHNWNNGNMTEVWVKNLRGDLRRHGAVDLENARVPGGVVAPFFAPDNTLDGFVPLLSDKVRFPRWSPRLATVAGDGTLRDALVDVSVEADIPNRACGRKVTERGRTIALTDELFAWDWWIRIGYLSSDASPVTISAGGEDVEAEVEAGIGMLYLQVTGPVDRVRIDGLDDNVTMCVDQVEVGEVVPGGQL